MHDGIFDSLADADIVDPEDGAAAAVDEEHAAIVSLMGNLPLLDTTAPMPAAVAAAFARVTVTVDCDVAVVASGAQAGDAAVAAPAAVKASRMCGVCKKIGVPGQKWHNSRSCPDRPAA